MSFYAVRKGRNVGIFYDWDTVKTLVNGFPAAEHKKFRTLAEAQAYLQGAAATPAVLATAPSAAITTNATVPQNVILSAASSSNAVMPENLFPSGMVKVPAAAAPEQDMEAFCDGSCLNRDHSGFGVKVGDLEFCGPVPVEPGLHTNQLAELYALYYTLSVLDSNGKSGRTICTDSSYAINCATTWYPNWVANGWRTSDGNAVKYKELICAIVILLVKTNSRLKWVKGHSNNSGNNRVDVLAKRGAGMK